MTFACRAIFLSSLLGLAAIGCGEAASVSLPSLSLRDGPVQRLSESGLYSDLETLTVDPAHRFFAPSHELWSDGGAKRRWLFLPPGETIDSQDMDVWVFPVGTIVWKEFTFQGRRIETRMIEKLDPGRGPDAWSFSTFLWNESQTDAIRVNHGRPDVAATDHGTSHDIPSVIDGACTECHDSGGDVLLGVGAVQLSGAGTGLRLADLIADGRLSHPPTREPEVPTNGAERAILGGLHANCAHCHSPLNQGRAAETGLYLQLPASVATRHELPAVQTAIGTLTRMYEMPGRTLGVDSYNIEPGAPASSALLHRLRSRDGGETQMPPLATEAVDAGFVRMMEEWIEGL